MVRKGNISIQTEDIFPIIKKWLYSEKDIFLRDCFKRIRCNK